MEGAEGGGRETGEALGSVEKEKRGRKIIEKCMMCVLLQRN